MATLLHCYLLRVHPDDASGIACNQYQPWEFWAEDRWQYAEDEFRQHILGGASMECALHVYADTMGTQNADDR